ncbi:MAG: DUF3443 family protein [Pseudomonadota bacterium]|jgi:hypothetical protein|uniref:DUF3443 family protein n=1 Tax=Burkholderiaceae TaxID=119060 RepID=UPI0020171C10|nr:DUF3443 family protein [Burkholderia sp. 4M9327F10]
MNQINTMRTMAWALVAALLTSLAACGGGGGGSSSATTTGNTTTSNSSNTSSASTPASTPATTSTLSSANPTAVPTASTAANTVPVLVSVTQFNRANAPMASVTVCTAGTNATSNCTTINNVLVDTESFGLRLFASAIASTTLNTLTLQTSGSATVAECALFGSGYSWGTVRNADIKLGGEVGQNVPIQVMEDTALTATAPSDCQQAPAFSQPSDLGANGILGVGVAPQDCGSQCVTNSPTGHYYACSGATCSVANRQLAQQVGNPVQYFTTDNNGVVLEMPAVGTSGAASASGTLVFGIDTQSNNTLAGSGATVLTTDSSGDFTATYNGVTFSDNAFFDSGSNVLFFQDATIATNGLKYFVPSSTLARSVAITGGNSVNATIDFNVANANTLFASGNYAFNNLASYLNGTFDLGMPFFYGRHVYYGISGTASAGGGTGPYVGFTSS